MARLAVVIGDPTGIGPEVLARALTVPQAEELLVIGDAVVWQQALQLTGVHLPAQPSSRPGRITASGVPFLDLPAGDRGWRLGELSPAAGRAAATWMERAVRLALDRAVDGLVFAPLNKQAIIKSGYPVRDEYELCAKLAGVEDYDEMNVIPHPAA
ncbi:MAG: 4-hydroxythreonine-4-phosphate dehydrogenase PdxA, partial [Dehalococcoidia bacterium]|nr:4-hydroxythreonine-4-phosphate dehydrogenase PdxA [Dehalococcoidia bacterium]